MIRKLLTAFIRRVRPQPKAPDVTAQPHSSIGGGFILGDRDRLPAYFDRTAPADRQYGYLADRDTGFFSTGDPGKTL